MKRFLLIALLFLVSCTKSSNTFVLNGEVLGAESGEEINLYYPIFKDGVWYERQLTTKIDNGSFRFEGELDETSFAYLSFENMDELQIFIEPSKMNITMERTRPYAYTMRGVSLEDEHKAYREYLGDIPQVLYKKSRKVQDSNQQWLAAHEEKSEKSDSLMMTFYAAVQEFSAERAKENELRLKFLSEYSDLAIAPYLLYECVKTQSVDSKTINTIYENLSELARNSSMGKIAKIQIDIATSDVGGEVGDKAFDFSRCGADGENIKMSDCIADGEYLLLDFWASWCLPCLKEIPILKKAYEKYNARGLKFMGISSDDDVAVWRNAIEKYNLSLYPQVLSVEPKNGDDELFFSELADVANRYEVESIPCFILVNDNMEVVARWQHFSEEIFSYLDTLLTK